jgi:hypothetical protein
MQLGEQVNGLMMDRHWRFVVHDLHGVAEAVKRHDSSARLVAHDELLEVAVARFIERRHLSGDIDRVTQKPITESGGAYMLVFRPRRPDGSYMRGEPDMTVLDQLRARDVWARSRGVDAREVLDDFKRLDEYRERKAQERLREKLLARTEERMHALAKQMHLPWRPGRIIVPRGVNVGRR